MRHPRPGCLPPPAHTKADLLMRALILSVLLVSAYSCNRPPPTYPENDDPRDCAAAAENLNRLGCEGMARFQEVCEVTVRDGLLLHLEDIVCASTCEEADMAYRGEWKCLDAAPQP